MLAAAVIYCRDALGITQILVTCDQSNAASRRVIEANGGVLENVLDGECRYWINPKAGKLAGLSGWQGTSMGCDVQVWQRLAAGLGLLQARPADAVRSRRVPVPLPPPAHTRRNSSPSVTAAHHRVYLATPYGC